MSEHMEPKGASIPMFYSEPVENTFRSKTEGRPIFDDLEFVKILIPGDNKTSPVKRVDDEDRARWPQQYEAFKAGQEAPVDGTPLKEWPPVARSQVMELAHFNILSVEHLAAVDDSKLQNLGMGARELREKARKFLDVAKNGTGPLTRLVEENLTLRDENARLTKLTEEQATIIRSLENSNARTSA